MSDEQFQDFHPSQHQGGEGVRGLAPWSWSIFWVSRCQMKSLLKSFPTSHVFLPSFLLHFLLLYHFSPLSFFPPTLKIFPTSSFSFPLWKSSPLLVFPSPFPFFPQSLQDICLDLLDAFVVYPLLNGWQVDKDLALNFKFQVCTRYIPNSMNIHKF